MKLIFPGLNLFGGNKKSESKENNGNGTAATEKATVKAAEVTRTEEKSGEDSAVNEKSFGITDDYAGSNMKLVNSSGNSSADNQGNDKQEKTVNPLAILDVAEKIDDKLNLSERAAKLVDRFDEAADNKLEAQDDTFFGAIVSAPKKFLKKAVAIGAVGAVALSVLVPVGADIVKGNAFTPDDNILNPAPIVMDIGDIPEEDADDEDEEEKKASKMSIIERMKLAMYGFFGAIGLWLGTKVPWKKILTKRNFIILIFVAIAGVTIYIIWKYNTTGELPDLMRP